MALASLAGIFGKKVLLLTHAGADVDAFASAAAIHLSLKGKSKTTICVPEHINLNAKALASKLNISYQINCSFTGFDAIVCLDFNKSKMLGALQQSFLDFPGEKYIIDHHSFEKEVMAQQKNSLIDSNSVSTTEIVYRLLKKTKLKIPRHAYACLALGIITDSSSFLIADHNTFRVMADLMEQAKMPYSELVALFRTEKDFSEKIAALKAAKRVRIYRVGDSIIATSEVGSFEAEAASALIRIGADVTFCGYADKKIRISGRVNNRWLGRNRFDLARDVFNPLEKFFQGEGGGHAGAAGFNGSGSTVKKHLEKCVELVQKSVSKNKSMQVKEYA
ncbi:MAG: hypothetical protein COV47_02270 [Candidatus Diapherotrites archaeon CG11_big_fil_rev_8_21_14_0_20_37_9]|nr:MAG: hypothetical protein COV47_02270 [Candidatus Diapherotrites archaeon CG11_big_fil_rev_8_21_14_0_20_37_9]